MEFDQELLINFAPVLLIFCFTIVTLLTVFYKLKVRRPIKANCWFCNYNVRIWRENLDWWLCPSCTQYNGFSKDGDYKYPIPEQNRMPLTPKFYTIRNASKITAYKNYLCTFCNKNEELKLLEFRKFEKMNTKQTENEVQKFKETIEKKYPLCFGCKQIVNDVLHKQSLWLTRYKMMIFKQKPVKLILHNRYKIERISRILLIIIAITIICNNTFWPLSTAGILLQLGICLIESKYDKQEIFLIILWMWISILTTLNGYLAKTNSIILCISLNCILKYFVIALGSVIAFMNVKPKSFRMSRKNLTFKKLDATLNSSESEVDLFSSPGLSSLSVTSFSSPSTEETLNVSNKTENLLDTAAPNNSSELLKNNPSYFKQFSTSNCDDMENLALNDSLNNLSTLSLNQGHPEKLIKTSSIFETKTYSTSNSLLFSKYNMVDKNTKRSILTPSKLKSITGSWMAGRYGWQDGMDMGPSLSRSSSQSSSLGSTGFNVEPPRETPIYNDFDQCSIVSGTMQCCCSSHKLRHVSLNSNCRFNSSFNRPTCLACNQLTDFTHNQTSFKNSLPLMHLQVDNSSVHNQYMKLSENLMRPVYTGPTTVITNPFWLPLILCYCTLIVNIIILCVILLR